MRTTASRQRHESSSRNRDTKKKQMGILERKNETEIESAVIGWAQHGREHRGEKSATRGTEQETAPSRQRGGHPAQAPVEYSKSLRSVSFCPQRRREGESHSLKCLETFKIGKRRKSTDSRTS